MLNFRFSVFFLFLAALVLAQSATAASFDIAAYKGLDSPPVWVQFEKSWGGAAHRYSVWGGNTYIDGENGYNPENHGYTLLGHATDTQTFTGSYKYYCIKTIAGNFALVDAVQGSDSQYLGGALHTTGGTMYHQESLGAPDGNPSIVGGISYGAGAGYIVVSAPTRSLNSITVIVPNTANTYYRNAELSGWSLHERDGYILESKYYMNSQQQWALDGFNILKIDGNSIYYYGWMGEDGFFSWGSVLKMARTVEEGEKECFTLDTGMYCSSISKSNVRAPFEDEELTGCISYTKIAFDDDFEKATEVICDGKLIQRVKSDVGYDNRNQLYRRLKYSDYVSQSGTNLNTSPFSALVNTANSNFDAIKNNLPTTIATPSSGQTRVVVVPLM